MGFMIYHDLRLEELKFPSLLSQYLDTVRIWMDRNKCGLNPSQMGWLWVYEQNNFKKILKIKSINNFGIFLDGICDHGSTFAQL